jgi:chromosome segregation ATPase
MIILVLLFAILAAVFFALYRREIGKAGAAAKAAQQTLAQVRADAQASIQDIFARAQATLDQATRPLSEAEAELQRRRESLEVHFENECRKVRGELEAEIAVLKEALARYKTLAALADDEKKIRDLLAEAMREAEGLRTDAAGLIAGAKDLAEAHRRESLARSVELQKQADALLRQATKEAARIVRDAEAKAEEIGGDAYRALREKDGLDSAIKALRNVIDGYGDRYIVPTRSLLDELAQDFSHVEAGVNLTAARAQSKRLVEEGGAATCEYVETNRRETAVRFVVDAFNGRVDAILSRAKSDNFGTLSQEIQDAFSLVNLNGQAFRDARVLPVYLESRLAELKWAVVALELKQKEREEQRAIKERIKEEEKARREYEKAMHEAAQQEELIRAAMEKAQAAAEAANAEQREKHEAQLALLRQQLAEAEARNERAKSMAQQTRAGHVYIISNIGSFGEQVFKIGMTRRLEPQDRIKELGDASVPFEFDVHAMIYSEDAPKLEHALHDRFDDLRLNKVNFRKEFFRVPLDMVREFVEQRGLQASFTLLAQAREFHETQAIERMSPTEREAYYARHQDEDLDGE